MKKNKINSSNWKAKNDEDEHYRTRGNQHSDEFWEMKKKIYRHSDDAKNSSVRLTIDKNFQTCIIGALASFENKFGYLWGHGKEEEDLTDNEIRMWDLWQEAREDILNKGNDKRRQSLQLLNNNNRYEYNFKRRKS